LLTIYLNGYKNRFAGRAVRRFPHWVRNDERHDGFLANFWIFPYFLLDFYVDGGYNKVGERNVCDS